MKTEKTSNFRKLAIQGFDLVVGGHNFYGLLEFDISQLRKELRTHRQEQKGGSLYAFLLKALACAIEKEPQFNSFINYKRITTFDAVDINIPVEVSSNGQIENRQLIIRNVAHKSLQAISEEIARAKANQEPASGFLKPGLGQKILCLLPRALLQVVMRLTLLNHSLVQKLSGTVFATSVSMFSNVPGFIIPYIGGPKAASFAFGSIYKKPLAIGNKVEIREVLSMTAIFNHDIIDGAPAARFINQLRRYIEQDHHLIIQDPAEILSAKEPDSDS